MTNRSPSEINNSLIKQTGARIEDGFIFFFNSLRDRAKNRPVPPPLPDSIFPAIVVHAENIGMANLRVRCIRFW